MNEPHICELGAALTHALNKVGGARSSRKPSRYEPLISIQAGDPRFAPLICVPGAAATVADFSELAETLAPIAHVYGLQWRGLDGEAPPHTGIGTIARSYVEALQRNLPTGPYRLLGHSFGGWVAFEMALQLAKRGAVVAELVILDAEAPGNGSPSRHYERIEVLEKLIELYNMRLKRPLALTRQELSGATADAQNEILHNALVKAGILSHLTTSSVLDSVVRVFHAHMMTSYCPGAVYPGPTTLVSADDVTDEQLKIRLAGWRQHAPKLRHRQVSGNHVTMLSMPHVRTLGDLLKESAA